ncbi:sugar transferase [Terriglobus sp.]|uniref:sugar transferase n=1 Tax=Terriglobus sp. TaxID=1889013 RepID=UPI003B00D18C
MHTTEPHVTEEASTRLEVRTELASKHEGGKRAALNPKSASYSVCCHASTISAPNLNVTPIPATRVHPQPVARSADLWVHGQGKRAIDLFVALGACLLVAPLMVAIAIAVKLTSRGPVLFRQERMGMGGKSFTILKFRTMRVQEGPSVTARNDARITGVGRLLRRTKLDELPQIVNVLRGDMSLVGPRPKISEHQASELICRPGLTGAATLAFIEEEKMLVTVPEDQLETYVVDVLHRIKSEVDHEYALRSTLRSDLLLLSSTALHLFRIRRSQRVEAMKDRVRNSQPS